MPKRKTADSRTPIRGIGWKKRTTIAADKYDAVSAAILAVLSASPIRFTELVERVAARLPAFQGSVSWYTITCARELEVRGEITRHTRPVLYSRSTPAARRRVKAPPRSRARGRGAT